MKKEKEKEEKWFDNWDNVEVRERYYKKKKEKNKEGDKNSAITNDKRQGGINLWQQPLTSLRKRFRGQFYGVLFPFLSWIFFIRVG